MSALAALRCAGAAVPSIYVYALPARDSGTVLRDDTECEGKHGAGGSAEGWHTCLFGPLLAPFRGLHGGRVRDIDQFALGRLFFAHMQEYPNRATMPDNADLFYIPVFHANFPEKEKCPSEEWLLESLPHLNEKSAPRHILVSPRVAWDDDVCPIFNAQSGLLAKVTKLALEPRFHSKPSDPLSFLGLDMSLVSKRSSRRLLPEHSSSRFIPPSASNLHSVPYPSIFSTIDVSAAPPVPRDTLISCLWGLHGSGDGMRWRGDLRAECERRPRSCTFWLLDPALRDSTNTERALQQATATFCVEPPGDTPSRKGMVDAISLGCIPVVWPPADELWAWHVGDWSDFAVVAAEGESPQELFDRLEGMSPESVADKQRRLPAISRRLAWSVPGGVPRGRDDALSVILDRVVELTRTEMSRQPALVRSELRD